MRYYTLFISFFILSGFFSQQIDYSNTRPGEDVEYCTTHKKLQELLQDPEFRKQFEEEQVQFRREEGKYKSSGRKRGTVLTIPVVFHVLHSGGVENISDEQIYDALSIMNRDFRLQNEDAKTVHTDFKSLPSDVEIEFKMATKAPDGTCFSGITRTFTTDTTSNGNKQVSLIKAGNDVFKGEWTGNKYLHFFICKYIGGAAGYTYRPWGTGSTMTNGIWILHTYVGSIGTSNVIKSRALTHEVGHWLNLMHTWGGNNNPGNTTSCNDLYQDEVDDTPPTIGVTRCNLNENSCGPRANVENYMDYSYCNKMFTPDQVTRMRTALLSTIGGRNIVSSAANLSSVGVLNPALCSVDFKFDQSPICSGSEVSFEDLSFNNVVTRKWNFPGGIPSESNEVNPKVVYKNSGKYTVSLTVSDGFNTLTKTIDNAVTVAPMSLKIPFYEDFQNSLSNSNFTNWTVSNDGKNETFKIFNGAGYSDNNSLYLNNFKDKTKSIDALISNSFDLSLVKNESDVTLSFMYAYKKIKSTDNEFLRVYFSSDCGKTWSVKRVISGDNLSSLTELSDWKPSSQSDWKKVVLNNFTTSFWNSNVRVKIEFEGNGGNNLFIDDINLYPSAPVDTIVKLPTGNTNYDYTIDNVDIIANNNFACLGANLSFRHTLSEKVTQWKWTFDGGYPNTSIEEKPSVIYSKPGIYNVSLTAGNGFSSKSITKTGFIIVDASKKEFPIIESFDTLKSLEGSSFWVDPNKSKLVLVNKSEGSSNQFITFKPNSSLISKQLSFLKLKDTSDVYISFDLNKIKKNNSEMDTLSIFLSDNCGNSWKKIKSLTLNQQLLKDSIGWNKIEFANFDKSKFKQFTLMKFEYSGINELNLDNLLIYIKKTTGVPTINEDKILIFPNPTSQDFNVSWNKDFKVVKLKLTDIVGKVVKEIEINENINSVDINVTDFAHGTYYVNLINSDFIQISKPIMVR